MRGSLQVIHERHLLTIRLASDSALALCSCFASSSAIIVRRPLDDGDDDDDALAIR